MRKCKFLGNSVFWQNSVNVSLGKHKTEGRAKDRCLSINGGLFVARNPMYVRLCFVFFRRSLSKNTVFFTKLSQLSQYDYFLKDCFCIFEIILKILRKKLKFFSKNT